MTADIIDAFIQRHAKDSTNTKEIRSLLRQYETNVIERTDAGLQSIYHDPGLDTDHLAEFIGWLEKTYIEADAVELFGYLLEQYQVPLGPSPHNGKLSRFGRYLGRYLIALGVARGMRNLAPIYARKLAARRGWKPGGAEQDRYDYITTSNLYTDAVAYVSSVIDGDDEAARKILGGGAQMALMIGRIGQLLQGTGGV